MEFTVADIFRAKNISLIMVKYTELKFSEEIFVCLWGKFYTYQIVFSLIAVTDEKETGLKKRRTGRSTGGRYGSVNPSKMPKEKGECMRI